jgi:hypothetical protein
MPARHADTPNHSLWDVRGVGHNGDRMLTSACGLQALFDVPGCQASQYQSKRCAIIESSRAPARGGTLSHCCDELINFT